MGGEQSMGEWRWASQLAWFWVGVQESGRALKGTGGFLQRKLQSLESSQQSAVSLLELADFGLCFERLEWVSHVLSPAVPFKDTDWTAGEGLLSEETLESLCSFI
jgi:hypothetical protein